MTRAADPTRRCIATVWCEESVFCPCTRTPLHSGKCRCKHGKRSR